MLESTIIIDGRDHLLGRLCSIVAKELLAGQNVVIVRCDEMCISGSLTRNKVKYAQFRKKRMNTNPRKGPFHYKAPSKMVWRTIRGMLNHKTARGQQALARLSTFEGIPAPYNRQKRKVVPAALRILRLKPNRNFTVMGDLADAVGWKHKDLLARLEAKRKVKSEAFWQKKVARKEIWDKAEKDCEGELSEISKELQKYGY